MIDLIFCNHGEERPTIKCLDEGFVSLVDCMPRISKNEETTTADHAIVQAARVSYGEGTKTVNNDRGLIRYLMRHKHSTPMEMVEFKFHCKMPVFVARQWIRTRTANVNEISGRYSQMNSEFYQPRCDELRCQSKTNKQGSDMGIPSGDLEDYEAMIQNCCEESYSTYKELIQNDVAREQARMVLPLNLYTEWYWKIDLHNLLHFLALRCDEHAQKEIQVYANAMLELIKPIVPETIAAWEDYHPMRGAIILNKGEIEMIKDKMASGEISSEFKNNREQKEWEEKAKKLGII